MNDFGITKEELLNLAAEKLADQHGDNEEIESLAQRTIEARVKELFAKKIEAIITETLSKATNDLLSKQYQPVDMWGEQKGNPTTLREQLELRARNFWDEKVDENGKLSGWHGKPRHEHLYGTVIREVFEKAIKDNASTIVAQFKAAITADAVKLTTEHINRLIK